jgi:hypothetical protein
MEHVGHGKRISKNGKKSSIIINSNPYLAIAIEPEKIICKIHQVHPIFIFDFHNLKIAA